MSKERAALDEKRKGDETRKRRKRTE